MKVLLVTALVVLATVAAVAVAPTASADHVDCSPSLPRAVCDVVELHDPADCLSGTPPEEWAARCL